jgi:hypothetical protein
MNKLKELYKISINENKNRIQLLKELEALQDSFSKQQFMIISLQEQVKFRNEGNRFFERRE